jgi:hypothetical protein
MLHIERLVIDEATLGGERAANVRAVLERDLARQLAQPGALDTLRSVGVVAMLSPAVLPPPFRLNERLGSRVAVAVRQSLGIASVPSGKGMPGHG